MHRTAPLVCLTLAACGRIGFGLAAGDGATGDDSNTAASPYATPRVVQANVGFQVATGIPVTMAITDPADVIVVAIAGYDGVVGVADDGNNTYVTAEKQMDSGDDTAEIWYAPAGQRSARSILVTMPTANNTVVWVTELANIDPANPLVAARGVESQAGASVATAAAITTARPNSVVIDVGAGGASFDSIVPGAFTELESQYGDVSAYVIAAQPGDYAASWNVSGPAVWSIASVGFAPAPL